MPLIRKSCLKPTRRYERESECSDDFIVFTDECDSGTREDDIFCEGDSDCESDSDDSDDDEMDGIEEEDESEDEDMSEDDADDQEPQEIQVDSGVEEKRVRRTYAALSRAFHLIAIFLVLGSLQYDSEGSRDACMELCFSRLSKGWCVLADVRQRPWALQETHFRESRNPHSHPGASTSW